MCMLHMSLHLCKRESSLLRGRGVGIWEWPYQVIKSTATGIIFALIQVLYGTKFWVFHRLHAHSETLDSWFVVSHIPVPLLKCSVSRQWYMAPTYTMKSGMQHLENTKLSYCWETGNCWLLVAIALRGLLEYLTTSLRWVLHLRVDPEALFEWYCGCWSLFCIIRRTMYNPL